MNRRNRNDRCAWQRTKSFPFRDSSGQWVHADRRILLGRRGNSIEATWHEFDDEYEFAFNSEYTVIHDG